MSMMMCPKCSDLVDSDAHPEQCPHCEAELFPLEGRRPEPTEAEMEAMMKSREGYMWEDGELVD